MGMYIETPENLNKTGQILVNPAAKATQIQRPIQISNLPSDKALVCVVENGPFDAAGIVYDERELRAFDEPDDHRPKFWLMVDKEWARQECPEYDSWLLSRQ